MCAARITSHRPRRIVIAVSTIAATGLILTACGGTGQAGTGTASPPSAGTTTSTTLTSADIAGLRTVRAEEKAGADAYHVFAGRYAQPVFAELASSQTTQEAMITMMMSRFGVADPTSGSPSGSFTDPAVQHMYDAMIAAGSGSANDALNAMAAFEHQHAADMRRFMAQTGQPDMRRMYTNLMRASANHLDACDRAMDGVDGMGGMGRFGS